METTGFFFWEILKIVSLTFLGVVCAKAVAGLPRPAEKGSHPSPSQPDTLDSLNTQTPASAPAWTRFALYAGVLLLVAVRVVKRALVIPVLLAVGVVGFAIGMVVIQVPKSSPFTNQDFRPQKQ